ncbi:MAG: response regulator transcription factor [Sphingobacteriales bacterium]|nr:response regulator transcription factor [Sphingobacteriales bacterium]
MNKIKLLIIEDHTMVREMWKVVLNAQVDFEIIAECGSVKETEEMLNNKIFPDVIMLDINLAGDSGINLVPILQLQLPRAKILAVSMHNLVSIAKRIMSLGAFGYVTKNSTNEELFEAIRTVNAGKKFICREIKELLASQLMGTEELSPIINKLSKREIQVIHFLKEGKSSRDIAEELKISLRTVEVHRYNILRKLKLKNTAALVNYVNKSENNAEHNWVRSI